MTDQTWDNELSGVLFKNDKEGNDKRPDYTGKATVEGTEYRLAAWIKEGRTSGNKFLSLKLSLPEAREPVAAQSAHDADIPF